MSKIVLRVLVPLVWLIFALILTTQTDHIPVVQLMIATIGSTDVGDAIGHAGLFGLLAFAGYATFTIRLPRRRALLLAVALALVAGTATEFYQVFVAGRSASLSDLLANWLGILAVGFIILATSGKSNKGQEIY